MLEYGTISEDEWEDIESCLTLKSYRKGELLLEAGQICRKLYFLEDGFLRFFAVKNGDIVTKYFTEPPYSFTSQRSFANEIPAEDSIEVLQDSKIWEMDRKDAFRLLKVYNWSEFVRKLVQEVQYFTEQILEETQNKTASERYENMLETNSKLLQNVPLKDIASYLGIAPQSLSRIRKAYFEERRNLT